MKCLLLTIPASLMLTFCALAQSPGDPNEGSQLSYNGTSGYTFSWWGKAGRTYFIQHSDDLIHWSYVPTFEQGADQSVEWGLTSSASMGFLRLEFQTDGNPLPDSWQTQYFGNTNVDPDALSPSEDGYNNFEEFLLGRNPNDYYNGQSSILTIQGGDNQTGAPSAFVPKPLLVLVSGTDSQPFVNAPVTFTVTQGTGQVQRSSSAAPADSVVVRADENGIAKAFFQLPNAVGSTNQIKATTSTNSTGVTFTEHSDDGTHGPYGSPFSPTNIIGYMNADGSEDISWDNNTDDQADIPLWRQINGTWTIIMTVPAGTTSAHIPPPHP